MTDNVKNTAPLILDKIKNAKNILLHCHPFPDPDSVGSALGMYFAIKDLKNQGITKADVTVIRGFSKIPKAFHHFPGIENIEDKSWSDINKDDYDLFLAQDSASFEMVEPFDIKNPSKTKEIIWGKEMTVITIDHHVSNTRYGHINLVDDTYAATGELLGDLFRLWNVKMNHDIASNLIMAMYSDTGGFSYSMVTPNTVKIFAELVPFAPEYTKCIDKMENCHDNGYLKYIAIALNNIQLFCEEKLAISHISFDDIQKNKITNEDISSVKIANFVKSVEGRDIAVSIDEVKKDIWKVSLRTRDSEKYNLSKIAGDLGGGGHRAAAGARIDGTKDEVVDRIVRVIEKYL